MKAVVRSEYGTSEVLTLEDVAIPDLGANDVLVRVRAASVNPADVFMLTGEPRMIRLFTGLRRPKRRGIGADFAGEVAAVGAAVSNFAIGDEVFGEGPQGSFAEYNRVNQALVRAMPVGLSFEESAALPMAAGTALKILESARLEPSHKVLVIGASGGVGSFAVQIAVSRGAEVTGVCSTPNVDLVRSLGAQHIVDYTADDFTTSGERWDVVLDMVGNRSLRTLSSVLAPNGTLVLCSGSGGKWLGPLGRMARGGIRSLFTKARITSPAATPGSAVLDEIVQLVADGSISPTIGRVVSLEETADAIDYVASRRARGKVIITV